MSWQSICKKVISSDQIEPFRKKLEGKKIVFTNGCFDLLHRGHVEYLAKARDLGDFLWLGLNSDSSVRSLKGPQRPIQSEQDRALILASLEFVDAVTIFSESTPLELLKKVRPSLHAKGGDYDVESLPETPIVRSLGGEVVILPLSEGKSTTGLVEKIKS